MVGATSFFLRGSHHELQDGSTSHAELPGLFETAVTFICPTHPSQITADTPDFGLMRQLQLQWEVQQRAWGTCPSPVPCQFSWLSSSSSFYICRPCPWHGQVSTSHLSHRQSSEAKCSVAKVLIHPSAFHLSLCTSLEMVIVCSLRPGCLAHFPKLVVSSSKVMVILAHSPVITCDQHPWLRKER